MTPTSGMNIAQRILHVGGRNNAAGYIEFGSIQAVEALVRQVLRDLPPADVPLLSDDEIYEMYSEPRSDAEMLEFGREVEAAVRKLFIAAPQAQQLAVEPVYWNAVLDPEQVPQQLNQRFHRCGFRHERDAKAFIETELDFSGWRYTLVPLYTAPQAQSAVEPADMCEQICAAIKAEDDERMKGDYMLDSDDCIRVVREFFAARQAQPRKAVKLTTEEVAAIVKEAAKGGPLRRDGSTSERIARAIEQAVWVKLGVTE